MKLIIASLVTAAAMMGLGVNATSMQAPKEEVRAASFIDLTRPVDVVPLWERGKQPKQYAQSLPDCSTIHGNYCSTPGTRVRCWWSQAGEPTICRCPSNHTWSCIGL